MINILRIIKAYIMLYYSCLSDIHRYFKYSLTNPNNKFKDDNMSSIVLAQIHSIERAFSLKNIKKEFGKELVSNLKNNIKFIKNNENYKYELTLFNSAIAEYNKYHDYSKENILEIKPYKKYKHIRFNTSSSFKKVILSRHSIRNFGDTKINDSDVVKAIYMAKNTTPSVCNRQGYEALVVRNKETCKKILALQNGNSGISGIQNIIVVCSLIPSFFGSNERNQPYIDGGIFLMSLLNCLHFNNIASCTLNWSTDTKTDKNLRGLLKIHDSRVIIALIAIGTYEVKEINIASSHRKKLNKIIKIVE